MDGSDHWLTAMERYEDSDANSDYHSDQIDSDTEVMLYSAIHHSKPPDDQQLTAESRDSGFTSGDSLAIEPRPGQWMDSIQVDKVVEPSKETPLSNIFELLDNKLDVNSDESADETKVRPSSSSDQSKGVKRPFDCIEISDSSDDSVVIIDDSPKTKNKTKKSVKKSKKLSPKVNSVLNISLGNVSNLNETTQSEMDRFYNEDNYDSEEEAEKYKRMSSDRNDWKISYTDLLVANKRSNRYYKNRFLCHNCHERGHQARDCPEPKKLAICHLCGRSGHKSEKCGSVICSLCLSGRHRTISCDAFVNQLVCDECGVRGHEANQCTYNWRKYHLTTTSATEEPIISNLRRNARKCCYNCGAIGKHFGFECRSKPMEKRLSPVSPLMPNTSVKQSHCFNGSKPNNKRNDCHQKALCNEFVKNISSNQLSPHLNASFNKRLDRLESIGVTTRTTQSVLTTTRSPKNNWKNTHIKWHYPSPDRSGGNVYEFVVSDDDSPNLAKRPKSVAQTMLRTSSGSGSGSVSGTAHTLTMTRQQINNSLQEESHTQTPTIPLPKERSKRAKNRRKKRKFVETTSGQRFIGATNSSNFKPSDRFRRAKRLKNQ